jgi:hypothetical protein
MKPELCEFYADEYCELVNDNCRCMGEILSCSYPDELRKHNKSCVDDWQADADREEGK